MKVKNRKFGILGMAISGIATAVKIKELGGIAFISEFKNEKEISIHSKTGTRITEEFGKTSFGNWNMVEPGHTSKVYFTYKLPFKVSLDDSIEQTNTEKWKEVFAGVDHEMSRYSLVVQKQSGTESSFVSRIIYPDDWSPIWQENDGLELASNGAEFVTRLETDEVFGLVMEKRN